MFSFPKKKPFLYLYDPTLFISTAQTIFISIFYYLMNDVLFSNSFKFSFTYLSAHSDICPAQSTPLYIIIRIVFVFLLKPFIRQSDDLIFAIGALFEVEIIYRNGQTIQFQTFRFRNIW